MTTPLNDGRSYDICHFDDHAKCAKVWAEGDKFLEKCLLNLWSNGIKTRACCAHDKYIYIQLDNFNNNLGGLFQLVEENLMYIKFGVLHINLNQEHFNGFFLSIHENKDNKTPDFFQKINSAIEKNISFDEGLNNFNHNLFLLFKKFQEKCKQPLFNSPLISRVQFLAKNQNAGWLDAMSEKFYPIKNCKLSNVYDILKSAQKREKIMQNL